MSEEILIAHGWTPIDYPAMRGTEVYSYTMYSHPEVGKGVWSLEAAMEQDVLLALRKPIQVLDKGYVWVQGNPWLEQPDLWIVNAARASFAKRSHSLNEKDVRLINFLATDKPAHPSPLRHRVITFEIKAPLMVARQWFKYRIGSTHGEDAAEFLGYPIENNGDDGTDDLMYGRNEMSRRYVTAEPEFYVPGVWRGAAANKKQGSSGPLSDDGQMDAHAIYDAATSIALESYNRLLALGVAAEQARLVLPMYDLYTNWWWTASYDGLFHFLHQRLAQGAQHEIGEYAKAIYRIVKSIAPEGTKAWVGDYDY